MNGPKADLECARAEALLAADEAKRASIGHPRRAAPRAVTLHAVVSEEEGADVADVHGGSLLHGDGDELVEVVDEDAEEHVALGSREARVPVGLINFALCEITKQLAEVAVEVAVKKKKVNYSL